MNSLELKAARVKRGYKQTDVAKALNISITSYAQKENGKRDFSETQRISLIRLLGLDLKDINAIFFNGELPSGIIEK